MTREAATGTIMIIVIAAMVVGGSRGCDREDPCQSSVKIVSSVPLECHPLATMKVEGATVTCTCPVVKP